MPFQKGHKVYGGQNTRFTKGHKLGMTGKHHTKTSNEKNRLNHIGLAGKEKHWNWRGGISTETEIIRHSLESKLWQDSVKNRDNNCCQKCGENAVRRLTAHHILNFSKFVELRFAIDNGITFCVKCHKAFHKRYTTKNNNREQLNEFLK
jgi:ribosomal protein L37AE/L43A